jgi:hypothetical protein
MSIELQLRAAALAAITSHNVRMKLRSTCPPPLVPGFSIDHLEVAADASVEATASSVQVHVPVDVFVVADAALFAAVNDVPDGATTPAAQIALVFALQVTLSEFKTPAGESATRTVLTLTPDRPDLTAFAPLLGAQAAQVEQSIQAILPSASLDLTSQLALLGVTSLRKADVVLADGVVAARFGAAGAPRSRLFPARSGGCSSTPPRLSNSSVRRSSRRSRRSCRRPRSARGTRRSVPSHKSMSTSARPWPTRSSKRTTRPTCGATSPSSPGRHRYCG